MRSLALLFVVACGGGGSFPPVGDAAIGGDLTCESGGTTFPELAKSCVVATDCFVARHQINCCGTFIAVGFNTSAEPAFANAETACAAAYPGCGCASLPTMAEDGGSEEQRAIEVRCESSLCRTFIP